MTVNSKPPSASSEPLESLTDFGALTSGYEDMIGKLRIIDAGELAAYLKSRVIGQNTVIDSICTRLHRRMAIDRAQTTKPIAVFCFAGAPGVGKSYLSKILAEKLFGSGKHLHFFEMGQLRDAHAASTLFGQPPEYRGGRGALSKALRDVPDSIILLDEFEKAHRDIHLRFLSAWNDGFITDLHDGLKYSTKDAIFVLTVNAGSRQIAEKARDKSVSQDDLNKFARNALQDAQFAPEILSRIDDVFAFRELEGLDIARVVALEIQKKAREYGLEIAGKGIDPKILLGAIEEFTKNKPDGGVREIARHLEEKIADGLINAKSSGARKVLFEADGADVVVHAARDPAADMTIDDGRPVTR
ncbi:MAG: ATP-dependent Clp protease ATP-binding subunit [Hyphomicrobiaceae bacterium]|nr:ATP-dependent Clp protease ATP-binding subunit [Hyphomicrobiaceae bacterium]